MNDFNLDDPQIMSASEAANKWGLNDSRLRQKIFDFPKGTARKFGKQWVVTEEGMIKVFGPNMKEEEVSMSKLDAAYNTVKNIADYSSLSVQRFPSITDRAVLVGGLVLVWLENLHWKELLLGGNNYYNRDYGGKNSLRNKFDDVATEIKEQQQKVKEGKLVISKYNLTEEAIVYLINKSIKKSK